MDNDDHVYQGQALRLDGEENTKVSSVLENTKVSSVLENTKVSSVLCPYGLPKFDFDEGHLRFDSLVENEVFLGIPSQEDNQWIEDFSRGSSGIEFSSSPADSCSIPRHNNVWSEATSSESVEMLLKSVGQEEMTPGEPNIRKSDAGDELPSSPKQMDDRIDKVENFTSGLPQADFIGRLSELNENPGVENARGESTSQVQEVDLSAYGSSVAVSQKSSVGVTEENLYIDMKSFDENQRNICTLTNESLNDKMQDPSISEVEVQHAECHKDVPLMVKKSNNQSVGCDLHLESVTDLTDFKNEDHRAQDKISTVDDKQFSKGSAETCITDHSPLQEVQKVETVEKCEAEVTASDLEEPFRLPLAGNSDLLTERGCNEEVCSVEPTQCNSSSLVAYPEGMEIKVQSESRSILVGKSSQTNQSSDGNAHDSPVKVGDNETRVISRNQKEFDVQISHGKSSLVSQKDDYLGITGQVGIRSSDIEIEQPLVSRTHFESSNPGGQVIKHADVALPVQTSTSVGEDFGVINESSKHGTDGAKIAVEDSRDAAQIMPPRQAVPVDIARDVSSSKQFDTYDSVQGVPVQEKDGEGLSPESGKREHDSVGSFDDGKVVGSLPLAEIAQENVEKAPRSEIDALVSKEKDPNSEIEGTDKISPSTDVGVPLLSVVTTEVVDHYMEQKSDQKGKREVQIEAPTDVGRPLLGELADETFQQYPDPIGETAGPEVLTAVVVSEVANRSANGVLAGASAGSTNVDHVVAERASVELLVHGHLNAKEGESAEATHSQNPDELQTEKKHTEASSEVQGGSISPETENPIATSDSVCGPDLSRSETNKQAGVIGSVTKNLPLSDSKERVGGNTSLNPMPPGVSVASKEEKSFTFDVTPLTGLPEEGISKRWHSVPHIQAHKRSMIVDGSPSTSGSSQVDPIVVQEISHGSQQTPAKGAPSRAVKGASERKSRRGSAKSGKDNARKGNYLKEAVPLKHSEGGDRMSASISSLGSGQLKQLEVAIVEHSGAKPGVVISVSGSSLPDLNTSSQVPLFFQQPFTDLQQLQLRAQIFVYGSLIQGVAPDEACMASAFGISDGGRSFWEPAWRACWERLHGQKSHPSSSETPAQSCSGPNFSDQANKQGSSQSRVLSTPAGRMSSKSTPSPVVNSMIPLSSPLWNISTPSCDALAASMVRGPVLDYQALSPIHAFQTPPMRNFTVNTSSWPVQSPFPTSRVSSAQNSAVEIDTRFPAVPITETVKLTRIKELTVPVSSTMKLASPNPIAHDIRQVSGAHARHSVDSKSRKRKKTSASVDLGQNAVPVTQAGSAVQIINNDASKRVHVVENLGQGVLHAQNHTQLESAPAVPAHFSTSVAITTTPNFMFKSGLDKPLTAVSLVSSIDHPKGGDSLSEKRPLKPEDIAKVEEAKLQAEEASAHAAIAVTHCQNVWYQLGKHDNSGLMSDVEAKLASAAVAIAASASIAKAAAAAAKIASNIALQAKLMADEAMIPSGTQNSTQTDLQCVPETVNNMGNATPASILKVGDGNNSIIFAAREAARKKIEAASAASRHAENLEAIVKAAELAAEAVSQAGKVVAIGDPLPISKLVEAGPEGYWKVAKLPSGQGAKSNNIVGNKSSTNSIEEEADVGLDHSLKEMHTGNNGTSPFPKETSKIAVDNHDMGADGASATRIEKDFRGQKNRRVSDTRKTKDVAESEVGLRSIAHVNTSSTLNDSGIKENCLVEVLKDNGDFTEAWFSATVMSLKDEKALVCYTDLEADEGSGKLKEWIPLEPEGNKQPRIRLAHPMTSMTFEGTRKRRRAAARDYSWSVNDRVDAWIENCWREGVIIEKNKKDETTLSIHFPAQGKTSVVRAWHLRPTLIWKDGEWIEWTNSKESLQGDTPQEKRMKLGSPPIESKGDGKMSKNLDFPESGKPDDSRLLPLSVSDKVFNIGSTRNEKKPETLRTVRSGLQKEGSKVIFGVPKPGKKRKFMEVSKHYVSDRSTKNNAPNDSQKFAKYLMPQVPGPRGWKNSSKVDSKEKQTAGFNKPRGHKTGKPQNLSTRILPQRDNSVISSASTSKDVSLIDNLPKNSISNDENDSGQQNLVELGSYSNVEEAAEEPISSSSQVPRSEIPRRAATLGTKSDRLKKGKPPPAGGKSAKVEAKDKPIPEAVEPRRSNRRIQPTSRLLEGLQSSLTISKIPSVPHDKSQRSHNRVLSKRE